MKEDVFLNILHQAVQIHKINRNIPGNWSSDDGYLGYLDKLKGKYDEWCKPGREDDQDLGGENT
jgi:hypothetical protein